MLVALMGAVIMPGIGLDKRRNSARAAESAKPKASEGYVVVWDDVLLRFVDAPGEHFQKARQSFLKKDCKAPQFCGLESKDLLFQERPAIGSQG